MDIRDEIYEYIVEKFEIEIDDEFDGDVNIFDYGHIDSLGAVTIIEELERRYGIKIDERDLMLYPMSTINEIAAFVETKIEST